MLEFVDSDLYFVQDKNNFINPLLQVGSGSGGPKITGSDRYRIRILIPAPKKAKIRILCSNEVQFASVVALRDLESYNLQTGPGLWAADLFEFVEPVGRGPDIEEDNLRGPLYQPSEHRTGLNW